MVLLTETILFFLLYFSACFTSAFEKGSISVRMPNARPDQAESYFCSVHHLNASQKMFVVGFEPKASMKVVHHMLLYGCAIPGLPDELWDCGSMSHGVDHHDGEKEIQKNILPSGNTCKSGQSILYAWARDAPKLDLPDGVAFQIGGDTKINHLVLQIHYADVSSFEDGSADNSGVVLHYTTTPQPKTAGVLVLVSGGEIPPHGIEHLDVICDMSNEEIEIHPFRFRTHTHNLGKYVSGYHVRRDEATGLDRWTRIGKKDPKEPQTFYPVENNVTVGRNDGLAARCTMVSDRDTPTGIGSTNMDEMCNFYIMYWSENGKLKKNYCSSPGAPDFYWNTVSSDILNNVPPYVDTDEDTYQWQDLSM